MKRKYASLSINDDKQDESESSSDDDIDYYEDSGEETGCSKVSLFDYETLSKINTGGEIIFRSSMPCKEKEKPSEKTGKFTTIDFNDNDYIQSYFLKQDRDLDMDYYKDFNESKCFFCNWFILIKKEIGKGKNEDVVYNTYPDIGNKTYNELMSYIDRCKNNFTLTNEAFNYYVSKIKNPMNKNIRNDKHSTKEEFPHIPAYEIYLHATHGRPLIDKLYNEANSLMDLTKYIKKNMGLIKRDNETGELLLDKDLAKVCKDSTDTAVKILSVLNMKNTISSNNVNNINITNNKKKI